MHAHAMHEHAVAEQIVCKSGFLDCARRGISSDTPQLVVQWSAWQEYDQLEQANLELQRECQALRRKNAAIQEACLGYD